MQLMDRFVVLIYPFVHDLGERKFLSRKAGHRRLERLDALWQPWWRRLSGEQRREALDDSFYFLPFVRDLLFPETGLLRCSTADEQVREITALLRSHPDLKSFTAQLPDDAVWHLTLKDQRLRSLRELRLETRGGETAARTSWRVSLDWVDLLLFPQEVGFLLLPVRFPDAAATVDDWARFLNAAAFVHPPTLDWELPRWSSADPERELGFASADLVDYLLQGWIAGEGSSPPTSELETFLSQLPARRTRYTLGAAGQVYGAAFHLYGYACLDAVPGNVRWGDPAPFASFVEKALYHLVIGFSPDSPTGRPHPRRLESMRRNNVLALWENWEGFVYPGRVMFLGAWPDTFTRSTLPRNVRSEYFYLHLFTLFQKLRLSLMSGELLRRERNVHRSHREAQRLWDAFIRFQNLYWFSEIAPLAQGKELYDRFQHGLDVASLYDQTKDEVQQLQEYYEGRIEHRIGRLVNVLTLFGLPAGLWVGLFGNSLIADAPNQLTISPARALTIGAVFYLAIGLIWLIARLFGHGARRRGAARRP